MSDANFIASSLRKQAEQISEAGHAGWGNLDRDAADLIEQQAARIADLESTSKDAIRREALDSELSLQALYEDACIEANKNAQDAERYRYLTRRVVITDASTPGLMTITVVDDAIDEPNQFLDDFVDAAIRALYKK